MCFDTTRDVLLVVAGPLVHLRYYASGPNSGLYAVHVAGQSRKSQPFLFKRTELGLTAESWLRKARLHGEPQTSSNNAYIPLSGGSITEQKVAAPATTRVHHLAVRPSRGSVDAALCPRVAHQCGTLTLHCLGCAVCNAAGPGNFTAEQVKAVAEWDGGDRRLKDMMQDAKYPMRLGKCQKRDPGSLAPGRYVISKAMVHFDAVVINSDGTLDFHPTDGAVTKCVTTPDALLQRSPRRAASLHRGGAFRACGPAPA